MTPSIGIRPAITMLFSFILLITYGCVSPGGNGTSKVYQANAKSQNLSAIYKSMYRRDYPDVINQAERLKAKYPNDNTLYYLQGYAYLKAGKDTSALGCFSKAISLNRNKGDVYFFRGLMYQRAARYQEAVDDFDRAIKDKNTPVQLGELDQLNGYNPDTRYHLPRIYYFKAVAEEIMKQYATAMDDINQAIQLSPEPNHLHYELRGMIHFLQYQFALSYNDYQMAVQLYPTITEVLAPMGQCDIYLGNYARAIVNLKKAAEREPEYYGVFKDLGLAYALNGEYEKALENMGNDLRKNPDEMSYYNLAYFHHLNGNQGQALKFFKKAQALYPNIIAVRMSYLDVVIPLSSPARKFFQEQAETAKIYLETGKTPSALANENKKPILNITNLSLQPNPVPANKPFAIVLDFKADIPGGKNQIPTLFYFTISQNDEVLYTSDSNTINADNSRVSNWTQYMNPVPAKGIYTIHTYIKYKELSAEKNIELNIN